ncbi:translational GTPase TypA [Acetobacterium wieringae]|uniref:Large ribosomal subunit assembly factor BipA n=1 Tax=Acetobacterium wieringae TaxID=52694 RepID=A0A1F2PKF4_9FIRM|nr:MULTISPECIES: translational GTPase TypA [Acetobacterium]MEA4807447.1 translational GTPase TypA [Acetobacterium wieringae]OFV71853.1 GTP-binding protein TypA/BipA [Acetobacterium wieringae]OXS24756.1 MAG: GTP-binding protein TypA [Acetobacterium sp. MES1]TYC85679.1 translational GTPase TypA [Acetobacterium wieringae]URN85058.1 translational GTPase TypA [Acetobacterium wieringae]
MNNKQPIINIAVIAHVDAGKSTLVDALLGQSNVFRENQEVVDCVMDSNDLERERGITIYSKNCSIMYKDIKINIVDTPGHADFSSEVERILKTVDTVVLLVDSSEGPMPQTRFVLNKSLEKGLNPILFINKIDKKDQRAEEVVDMVFDLFVELKANDKQLDFPVLYGIAKEGIAIRDMDDEGVNLEPLFETIVEHVGLQDDLSLEPLQMQVSSLAYDDYIGRLGIGKIYSGTIHAGEQIEICKTDGSFKKEKINQVFVYRGLSRVEVKEAKAGDIVVVSGIPDISIGETIGEINQVQPMELIEIEQPTLSMNFLVNKSPFAGDSGKFVTTRHIRARLEKELEVNVGLLVEELEDTTDGFKVSGRGELHLSILLENMRREGYEVAVSKPEVIMHRDENGKLLEPVELVIISVPEKYSGAVISKLNIRKGRMESMYTDEAWTRMEFFVPTRGLLGYQSEFINDTHGEGTMVRRFAAFEDHKGDIPQRLNGVLISQFSGETMAYSLFNLSDRGEMLVGPGTKVYEGMIIGINNRSDDMTVNPTKNKKMTNVRSSGTDEALKLIEPRIMTLEQALEFINDDELVELTPTDIRIRKKILGELERKRSAR